MSHQNYNLTTTTAIVIANMIGTGVFISLHFQAMSLSNGLSVVLLWLIGGLAALSGAFCYIEVAGCFNRSGGEYEYLGQIYHPALGFSAGLASLLVGFAAPLAASALALAHYTEPLLGEFLPPLSIALLVIGIVVGIQLLGISIGSKAQTLFTGFKLALILFFIAAPFFSDYSHSPTTTLYEWNSGVLKDIQSSAFWSNLTYVFLAYSGWNASTYILEQLENPKKTLPYSIIIGTLSVITLYIFLNVTFMNVCDFATLASGSEDVGNKVALILLGTEWSRVFSGLFGIALLSTLNSGFITAPRVAERLGKDHQKLSYFARLNKAHTPYVAILFIGLLTAVLLVFSLNDLITYVSISLSLFSLLVVIGLFILRFKQPNLERPFKVPFYPITPLIFIAINGLMIYYSVTDPYTGSIWKLVLALGTIVLGVGIYFLIQERKTTL